MNSIAENQVSDVDYLLSEEARQHHGSFLILGMVLVVLGIAAMVFPFTASLAPEVLVGVVLLISGATQTLHALRTRRWKGCPLSLLGGLIALIVGTVMLVYPSSQIFYLNLLAATFLCAIGVLRIFLALQLRPNDHWSWLLGSGIVALILAAVILPQWPQGSAWIFGLLVGFDLLFAGWTSIVLAGAANRPAFHPSAATE